MRPASTSAPCVRVQGTARIDTQGSLTQTGNSFDLALDGDGYFQIQMPGGQLGYTRAGNFNRSPEGLLVTSEGYQVQPGITVPANATSVSIGTDGTVTAQIPGQTTGSTLGQIQIASFPNPPACNRPATIICAKPLRRVPPTSASPGRMAAATCARAAWKRRTSTSSRNSST